MSGARRELLDEDDEFAADVAVLADPVRLRGLLEREGLGDGHGQLAPFVQRRRRAQRVEPLLTLAPAGEPDTVLRGRVVGDGDDVVGAAVLSEAGHRGQPTWTVSRLDWARKRYIIKYGMAR